MGDHEGTRRLMKPIGLGSISLGSISLASISLASIIPFPSEARHRLTAARMAGLGFVTE